MPMRFLLEATVNAGMVLSLDPERSHYLCKVMRMKKGDKVACFNGAGTSFDATLIEPSAKKSVLQVAQIDARSEPPSLQLHLGMSILKGQAMDRAFQQATELGATELTPVQARRSNVKLDSTRAENKMAHWRKVVAAACEQSGQLFLPKLNPPSTLDQLLQDAGTAIVFDMVGTNLPQQMKAENLLLLVGPEGGWDDPERSLFQQHKLELYRLGPHTLRAETTPAVALSLVQHLQSLGANTP